MHSGWLVSILLATSLSLSIVCCSAKSDNRRKMLTVGDKPDHFNRFKLQLMSNCGLNSNHRVGRGRQSHSRPTGGWKSRIAGGKYVERAQYPSVVKLYERGTKAFYYFCGGTLIHPRALITSTFCFMDRSDVWVSGSADFEAVAPLTANFIRARYYCLPDDEHVDIGLLVLDVPFQLGPNIWPACLASTVSPVTSELVSIGHGYISDSELFGKGMKSLRVKRVECTDMPGVSCWNYSDRAGRGSWCLGDAGGPILSSEGGKHYIHSVINGLAEHSCLTAKSFMHPGYAFDIADSLNTTVTEWMKGTRSTYRTQCLKVPHLSS